MVQSLEEVLAEAAQTRSDLTDLLAQFVAEREALKAATTEAHEAIRDLRAAIRDAKEEMRQTAKAEARKHLAKQMRAAAEILARDS
jgi:ABC-type transporter Mla subunit MlaD